MSICLQEGRGYFRSTPLHFITPRVHLFTQLTDLRAEPTHRFTELTEQNEELTGLFGELTSLIGELTHQIDELIHLFTEHTALFAKLTEQKGELIHLLGKRFSFDPGYLGQKRSRIFHLPRVPTKKPDAFASGSC